MALHVYNCFLQDQAMKAQKQRWKVSQHSKLTMQSTLHLILTGCCAVLGSAPDRFAADLANEDLTARKMPHWLLMHTAAIQADAARLSAMSTVRNSGQ